jgi:hypothetical protein
VIPPSGISSTALEQTLTVNGGAGGHREAPSGRAADGGVKVSEKGKGERMFKQMEKARKEELDKADVVKECTQICDKAGRRVGSPMDQKLVDGGGNKKWDLNYPEGKDKKDKKVVFLQTAPLGCLMMC